MPERKRSKDHERDSERFDKTEAARPGRAGGGLARDVGSEDELRRARKGEAGVTRVTKSGEKAPDKKDRSGG